MARETMLVVGAGASYGARMSEPHEHRPPLGKDLAGYLLGWYDENAPRAEHFDPWNMPMEDETDETAPSDELYDFAAEVRGILAEAVALCTPENPLGFEQVMARLLVEGETSRNVLTKVNSVIAISFLGGKRCFLGRADDTYAELLRRLKDRLRGVITPNYDLLSEEALDRVGLTFRYASVPGNEDAQVVMYKFHGSANFFQTPGSSGGSSLEAARQGVKPLTAQQQGQILSFSNTHPLGVSYPRENAFLEHKHKGAASLPVMVTYGPGNHHGRCGPRVGLSFSGASGSPLLSHEKRGGSNGFGEPSFDDHVAESKIIGIMSGHLLEEQGGLFDHSGLSYFTRAPSILALVEEARSRGFANEKAHPFVLRTED